MPPPPPRLGELAEAWDGRLKIVKVEVEKNTTLTERFDIRNIPTLILVDRGIETLRLVQKPRRVDIEPHLEAVLAGPGRDERDASRSLS